nr:unnamed protein product [Callosobruchus chinensis]
MPQCYVTSCTNYYGKTKGNAKVIYHMLPSAPGIAAKWSHLCGDKMLPPYARVCSDHFTPDCYQRDLQHELLGLPLRKKLKPNAVPNLSLPRKNGARGLQDSDQQYVKNRLNLLQGISLTVKEISKDNEDKKKAPTQSDDKDQIIVIPLKRSRNGQIKVNRDSNDFKPSAISTPNSKANGTKTGNIKKQGNSDGIITKIQQQSVGRKNNENKDKRVCSKTLPKVTIPETCKTNKENVDKDICISENHATKSKTSKSAKDDVKRSIKSKNNQTQCASNGQKQRTKSKEVECSKINKCSGAKMPMRSSIRIAKKKSIESMSDSFTSHVNSKKDKISMRERFSDKLKFMAKLELKYEKNNTSSIIDLDNFFNEFVAENEENKIRNESLTKMQIMEDVREGCNAEPSSPGHAEQRSSDDAETKPETQVENGYEDTNHHDRNENLVSKDDVKKEETQDTEEPNKPELATEDTYSNSGSPNSESNKRKLETEDYPIKRLRAEMHENFASRDKILNEFIEMADCNSVEQIHTFSEQLLAEIKTLNELAKEKEREWNNLIHLKKLKEELLIRMQRKKQVILLSEKSEYVDMLNESQGENGEEKFKSNMPQSILKANLTGAQRGPLRGSNNGMNGDKIRQKIMMPKTQLSGLELNGGLDLRQAAKQRPTLDVQSIIADYRQKHPETVPRRGRRIRTSYSDGSGCQLRQGTQDVSNELGLLLNTINMSKQQETMKSNSNESQGQNSNQDAVSFKDMLLQFAKLSQSERTELIQNAIKPPPPYPEVTVHPVPTTTAAPTNSLLHGILTKAPPKQSKSSFSPTLARLLTAPERASNNHISSTPAMLNNTTVHASNMSISEILCTSKTRNEITITPVDTQYEPAPVKGRLTEEEETEDSADRLVIDESNEAAEARRAANPSQDAGSDGDEVPMCQGCNQKPAQFVCAGCGNQWYCSRDCQVSAWDEHSEVCSG